MYPEAITFGAISINGFGVMVALAFLAGHLITAAELKRKGAPPGAAQDMMLWIVICSIAGAKIFFLVENFTISEIIANPSDTFFSRNGLTFYGGFLGGLAAGIFSAKRNGIKIPLALDAAAPALALAYGIGRVGCLLVGDDYGVASSLPWAMAFPNGQPPVDFTVHPTQIYETLLMLAVFAVLWRLRKKPAPDGWMFALYLVLAGTERFFIEFLRTTTQSPIPGLSVAQLVALTLIVWGGLWLFRFKRLRNP